MYTFTVSSIIGYTLGHEVTVTEPVSVLDELNGAITHHNFYLYGATRLRRAVKEYEKTGQDYLAVYTTRTLWGYTFNMIGEETPQWHDLTFEKHQGDHVFQIF